MSSFELRFVHGTSAGDCLLVSGVSLFRFFSGNHMTKKRTRTCHATAMKYCINLRIDHEFVRPPNERYERLLLGDWISEFNVYLFRSPKQRNASVTAWQLSWHVAFTYQSYINSFQCFLRKYYGTPYHNPSNVLKPVSSKAKKYNTVTTSLSPTRKLVELGCPTSNTSACLRRSQGGWFASSSLREHCELLKRFFLSVITLLSVWCPRPHGICLERWFGQLPQNNLFRASRWRRNATTHEISRSGTQKKS